VSLEFWVGTAGGETGKDEILEGTSAAETERSSLTRRHAEPEPGPEPYHSPDPTSWLDSRFFSRLGKRQSTSDGARRKEKKGCPPNPFDVCHPQITPPKPPCQKTKAQLELEYILQLQKQEMGNSSNMRPTPQPDMVCNEGPPENHEHGDGSECPNDVGKPCPRNRVVGACCGLGEGYLSAYGIEKKTEFRIMYKAKNLTFEASHLISTFDTENDLNICNHHRL
jgi:hypothetical protein